MVYEKTQKTNPHQITVNQHIVPKKSIERFTSSGLVELQDLKRGITRKAAPNDEVFLCKRVWDDSTETMFMKSVEDEYQNVVEKLINGQSVSEKTKDKAVTQLFSLWYAKSLTINASKSNFLSGSVIKGDYYTKDMQEKIEAMGMAYVDEDGTIPMRLVTGVAIQIKYLELVKIYSGIRWGLVHSKETEFIVPDCFVNFAVIPVTPNFAFIGNSLNGDISKLDASIINSAARGNAYSFVLSRDFTKTM
ncbi:hypothetical protein [Rheinheimera sp.]|uniref:hypothetical protein n=1 Tax=Rheinheimera sp. TaxID=1869214 RepID=UPI004048E626